MKKLFLVDVSSLFFRAFYAVRPLTSPSGIPVNAVYGFLTMILKLLKEEKPEYLVFCYDRKDPSFRKDIYSEYKANRSEMPEDLIPQIPYIKKLADYLGIPSMEVEKYEADDLIGTLTKLGVRNNMQVMIMSGDKDFAQLVEENIFLYDSMKNTKMGVEGVIEKFGVKPAEFIDFLALCGDSSDNIPGVMGIGPKGAQKLLESYEHLEGIYEHIDEIKGSIKDKLIKDKENAFLSRQLVTIVTDVKIDQNIESYRRRPFLKAELTGLIEELNFKTLEKNIWAANTDGASFEATPPMAATPVAKAFVEAKTAEPILTHEFKHHDIPLIQMPISELAKELKAGAEVWAVTNSGGVFIGIEEPIKKIFQLQGELKDLGKISDQLGLRWNGFDIKHFWHQIGCENPVAVWDALLAAYVVKPGESVEWDRVLARYTGELPQELPDGVETFISHLKLKEVLLAKLDHVKGLNVYNELDLPLAAILYKMEKRGIALDSKMLGIQSQEIMGLLQELEKNIHTMAGETFNIASPKQLSVVLFDKLKLPVGKKTKTGFSTDNEVLEKLKSQHPIAAQVLDYRELAKLKSTYVDSLPHLVKEDGRIHTTFNQATTTTGRLSSTDPNLQNIPIRTERGARVRKAFVAAPGNVLLSVDYSQIELRILAHFSEDPNLTKAFKDDLDIHTATAAEVFSVSLKEVTSEQRRAAKAVNFGIAYGQGAFGLAENLGIGRSEASDIIKRYFARFGRVQNYIEDTIASAKSIGYVETLAGRRRYMDELLSKNAAMQKFGERAAINAPIQGTASDIVRKAMIQVEQQIQLPMLLQVHDELIFEGKESIVRELSPKIVKIMESVIELKVPLKANAGIGFSWDDTK